MPAAHSLQAERRFAEFCDERLRALHTDVPPVLYHYTSVAGMSGIVQERRLRAYNIELMNDMTEVRYSASVMRAHLDRAYGVEEDPRACDLFFRLRQKIATITLANVFLLSLARRADALGMWRLYSERGTGFSLALPTDLAKDWGGHLVQCNYSSDALDDFCLTAIAEIRALYLRDVEAAAAADPDAYATLFLQNVIWFLPIFKHRVWKDEEEWRLIFIRTPESHRRGANGRMYVEVPSSGSLSIDAIWAGSDCDRDGSIVPLQKLLAENRLEHVPVHLSRHSRLRADVPPPLLDRI